MRKDSSKKVFTRSSAPETSNKQFVAPALLRAETSNNRICWRFCHVDHEGPWGFGALTIGEIMDKLACFESMTIHEIFRSGEEPGKHYEVPKLPLKEAKQRLVKLGFSDMTKISRLRLGGPIRLYGFLLGNCFHILWWDPKHEIWPSKK